MNTSYRDLDITSYKDLDIGQKLYIVEECGIDCSYFIEPYRLTKFVVYEDTGLDEIMVENAHHKYIYERKDFYKIFPTQDDAIKYCEKMGVAYSFLKEVNI